MLGILFLRVLILLHECSDLLGPHVSFNKTDKGIHTHSETTI